MIKQLFILLICSFLLLSCSYIEKNTKRAPIQKIDTIIDFNNVDAYPLFPNCADIPSREKQQICFQIEMSQHIYASLKEFKISVKDSVNDTILIKLKIDASGKTTLSNIKISDETRKLLPQFDSILRVGLLNLPTLQPAIKRAMPVTTEFTLPIVLKN
jgi:translation elongation factor EF-4